MFRPFRAIEADRLVDTDRVPPWEPRRSQADCIEAIRSATHVKMGYAATGFAGTASANAFYFIYGSPKLAGSLSAKTLPWVLGGVSATFAGFSILSGLKDRDIESIRLFKEGQDMGSAWDSLKGISRLQNAAYATSGVVIAQAIVFGGMALIGAAVNPVVAAGFAVAAVSTFAVAGATDGMVSRRLKNLSRLSFTPSPI